MRFHRGKIFADGVLDAVSTAVAGSGFNMFSATTSLLFEEAIQVSFFFAVIPGHKLDLRKPAV